MSVYIKNLEERLSVAEAEVERLRTALGQIAETMDITIREAADAWLRECVVIARRALGPKS